MPSATALTGRIMSRSTMRSRTAISAACGAVSRNNSRNFRRLDHQDFMRGLQKLQAPSSKFQINPNLQIPKRLSIGRFGTWSLELLWNLELRPWSFSPSWRATHRFSRTRLGMRIIFDDRNAIDEHP